MAQTSACPSLGSVDCSTHLTKVSSSDTHQVYTRQGSRPSAAASRHASAGSLAQRLRQPAWRRCRRLWPGDRCPPEPTAPLRRRQRPRPLSLLRCCPMQARAPAQPQPRQQRLPLRLGSAALLQREAMYPLRQAAAQARALACRQSHLAGCCVAQPAPVLAGPLPPQPKPSPGQRQAGVLAPASAACQSRLAGRRTAQLPTQLAGDMPLQPGAWPRPRQTAAQARARAGYQSRSARRGRPAALGPQALLTVSCRS